MAEDKKTVPGLGPGKDLTSKIATAYRNMPPEQRAKPTPDSNDIQNPDLDQAFDKMVDMYKVRRPERENAVVTFPAPATLRVPRPEAEEGEEYECPECGHNNPAGNQFCGMCGAAREDVTVVPPPRAAGSQETGPALSAPDSGVKHHHHHYHHHHYQNNPYLLLAVVLLLGVVAWQQWRDYKQAASAPVPAPVPQAQPQPPVQSQPGQSAKPASPAVVPTPDSSSKPAKKPTARTARPTTRPTQQGEPPGPQARDMKASPAAAAPPIAPYQSLTHQPIPALPSFSSTPPKPASVN